MAGGVAFDPAEFAAYKSSLAPSGGGGREPAPAADAFDPAEFQAFKASRQGGGPREAAPASFDERFGSGPMASNLDASDGLGRDLRRVADERLIGRPSRLNDATAALFGAGQGASLNLAGNLAAGAATVLGKMGVDGYGDGTRTFDENYERFHDLRDAYGRQSPKSSIAGSLAGAVAAAPLMPGLAGVPAASLVGRAAQYGVTGGLYGAAGEAIGEHDALKAVEGGGKGFVGGAVLGPVIEKLTPPVVAAAGKALEPIMARFGRGAVATADGFTPEARAALRAVGLDADSLPPELAQHIETAFAAKGASPAAAREALAAEQGISLSAGQATQDPRVAGFEARALAGRGGERAQGIAQGFADRQAGEIAAAGERLQGMVAGDAPRIADPRAAYEAAAERARQAAADLTERQSIAQRGVDDGLRAVRGRGETDALDGAAAAAQGVRDAAAQSRAGYKAAYDDVAAIPGQFAPGALDRLGSRVRDRLGADVPLDPVLTPAATRAIGDLDDVPGLFGLAPGEGPSLQQVEQLRRRILAYRGTTGQNATDRRAVDRILGELDGHAEDAMAVGLFGPRQAPRAAAEAGDGFPGFAGPSAGPGPGSAVGGPAARTGEPETLTAYLARTGGVPLDAEASAADLHKTYIPGRGTLARNDAPTWDQRRVHLAEEGFIPPDMAGTASARDVADWTRAAIQAERTGGRPTVRMGDEAAIGGRRAAETIEAQNSDHAVMVDRQARRMAVDLEGYGIGPRDLDRAALNDAAEHMVLGRHTDPVDAYEAALTARAGSGDRGAQAAPEIPFDGPTARATSDALPIGDTAPLAAMQRARALFREHQQAFRPRGVGDVAGQRLQRIVERDASPNEVSSMLFGSPGTGRVGAGQLQTLGRLREAVGADSDAWRETQRALIARHLGGEGRDLGQRLDYLLRGEGRSLTGFLSDEQRAGLGRLRAAVAAAENAHAPMPTWASDLERSGFDPNRIAHGLFGGSEMGSRVGAANEARAAKAFLGEASPEWSGLRQAAIQRLTGLGDGPGGAGRVADQIRAFVDGSGKGVAEALFAPAELGQIRRFGAAVRSTLAPDGTIRPDAGARLDAVKVAFDRLGHMVALHVGGIPGAAASIGAKVLREQAGSLMGARAARRSFEGGAPRVVPPPTPYAVSAGNTVGRALAPLGGY